MVEVRLSKSCRVARFDERTWGYKSDLLSLVGIVNIRKIDCRRITLPSNILRKFSSPVRYLVSAEREKRNTNNNDSKNTELRTL